MNTLHWQGGPVWSKIHTEHSTERPSAAAKRCLNLHTPQAFETRTLLSEKTALYSVAVPIENVLLAYYKSTTLKVQAFPLIQVSFSNKHLIYFAFVYLTCLHLFSLLFSAVIENMEAHREHAVILSSFFKQASTVTASALKASGGLTAPWPARARMEAPALLKTGPACALLAIVGLPAREVSFFSTSFLLPMTLFTQCHLLKACHISVWFEHTSNKTITTGGNERGSRLLHPDGDPLGVEWGQLKREAFSEESWTCVSKSLITHIIITSALDRCRDAVSMWGSHRPLHEEKCLLCLSGVFFLKHCLALHQTVPSTNKLTDCWSFSRINKRKYYDS